MSRWIVIVSVLFTVALHTLTPVQAASISTLPSGDPDCPHARWYKVASRINDDWPDGYSIILAPEPGMPYALGYNTWQEVYEDAVSLDGMITDVGIWHDSNFGSEAGNHFASYPAGLIPEGLPYSNSKAKWMYFTWSQNALRTSTQVMVRIQGTPDHDGPVMNMSIGINFPADAEFSLYIKK